MVRLPFGGNVGRKVRPDGLKSGSPEARDADRAKDAARKRVANAAKRAATPPPPLPAAGMAAGAASAPALNSGASAPPPGALDFNAPAFGAGEPAPLAWQPDSLRPLFEQLIEAAEEGRVGKFIGKCSEAGLTGKLLKEIQADAHFPKAAKVLLERSLPKLAAKWMNKSGLSAEFEDEVAVVSALLLIVQNDRKLSNRLDEVIAANAAEKAKADDKKP